MEETRRLKKHVSRCLRETLVSRGESIDRPVRAIWCVGFPQPVYLLAVALLHTRDMLRGIFTTSFNWPFQFYPVCFSSSSTVIHITGQPTMTIQ